MAMAGKTEMYVGFQVDVLQCVKRWENHVKECIKPHWQALTEPIS